MAYDATGGCLRRRRWSLSPSIGVSGQGAATTGANARLSDSHTLWAVSLVPWTTAIAALAERGLLRGGRAVTGADTASARGSAIVCVLIADQAGIANGRAWGPYPATVRGSGIASTSRQARSPLRTQAAPA